MSSCITYRRSCLRQKGAVQQTSKLASTSCFCCQLGFVRLRAHNPSLGFGPWTSEKQPIVNSCSAGQKPIDYVLVLISYRGEVHVRKNERNIAIHYMMVFVLFEQLLHVTDFFFLLCFAVVNGKNVVVLLNHLGKRESRFKHPTPIALKLIFLFIFDFETPNEIIFSFQFGSYRNY